MFLCRKEGNRPKYSHDTAVISTFRKLLELQPVEPLYQELSVQVVLYLHFGIVLELVAKFDQCRDMLRALRSPALASNNNSPSRALPVSRGLSWIARLFASLHRRVAFLLELIHGFERVARDSSDSCLEGCTGSQESFKIDSTDTGWMKTVVWILSIRDILSPHRFWFA